jgi:hypothetical protein
MSKFRLDDRVGYAQAFCQSVSSGWDWQGRVVGFEGPWVQVRDYTGDTRLVRPENLALVGSDAYCRIDAEGWIGHEGYGEKPRSKFR